MSFVDWTILRCSLKGFNNNKKGKHANTFVLILSLKIENIGAIADITIR